MWRLVAVFCPFLCYQSDLRLLQLMFKGPNYMGYQKKNDIYNSLLQALIKSSDLHSKYDMIKMYFLKL